MYERPNYAYSASPYVGAAAGMGLAYGAARGAEYLAQKPGWRLERNGGRGIRAIEAAAAARGANYNSMVPYLEDGTLAQRTLDQANRGHMRNAPVPRELVEETRRFNAEMVEAFGPNVRKLEPSWSRNAPVLNTNPNFAAYNPHSNSIDMPAGEGVKAFNPNAYAHELGHAADRVNAARPVNTAPKLKMTKTMLAGGAGLAAAGAGYDQAWSPYVAAGGGALALGSLAHQTKELYDEAAASYHGHRLGPNLQKNLQAAGYNQWRWNPAEYRRQMWNGYKTYLGRYAGRLAGGAALIGGAYLGANAATRGAKAVTK